MGGGWGFAIMESLSTVSLKKAPGCRNVVFFRDSHNYSDGIRSPVASVELSCNDLHHLSANWCATAL
jgi:hypothetical protein